MFIDIHSSVLVLLVCSCSFTPYARTVEVCNDRHSSSAQNVGGSSSMHIRRRCHYK